MYARIFTLETFPSCILSLPFFVNNIRLNYMFGNLPDIFFIFHNVHKYFSYFHYMSYQQRLLETLGGHFLFFLYIGIVGNFILFYTISVLSSISFSSSVA